MLTSWEDQKLRCLCSDEADFWDGNVLNVIGFEGTQLLDLEGNQLLLIDAGVHELGCLCSL